MRGLSATLTKAAVKFIAYDRSEDPAFANFMNAADDLTRLAAIENQYRALASVEEKERLLKFYEGSQVTIRLLESKEKIEAYVLNAADGLQGTIVKSLIPFAKQLKPKEMETILRQTVGVTAITEVSHFLRGRLADEDGPVEIREIFHFGLILSDNTKHSKSIVPEYVKSLVGENLVECVKRLLSKGDSLTAEEVKGLPPFDWGEFASARRSPSMSLRAP
jgi:hypothetical protein